ncbi:hypothetical protein Tco_0869249, partial [Tanacetum coccineum]
QPPLRNSGPQSSTSAVSGRSVREEVRLFDLMVYDLYKILDKVWFVVELEFIQWNNKINISYDDRDSFFRVGTASHVVPNDVLVGKCDLHERGMSQGSLCVVAAELQQLSSWWHDYPIISGSKKNDTLMGRVPKVGASRRHIRGDKFIFIFQLAGMFLCSGLRGDVCL